MIGVDTMKKIERISLIGLGAIGATFAGRIHGNNPDCLRVIVDTKRYEKYTSKGFMINGQHYNFNYVLPEDKGNYADLILVSVKYHDLGAAIENMKNHVGPNTIILPLLNGISSEEIIGNAYGMDKLLYGYCVAIDALRSKNEITYTSIGEIVFGEGNNTTYSDKVESVKEFFERMVIPYQIPENMLRALWWKFMVNVGINQVSAILNAPYKVFQEFKEAQELMESAMKEVVTLSQKMGIGLKDEDVKGFYKPLSLLSPEGKTSMHQDMEARRKTEVDMLAGTVCMLGEKVGVETPINKALLQMIRTLEQMNQN